MPDRPNILVLLTDDHGQWTAGCYGNREVRTPVMDHLADTGVQFAHAFTETPVCSPGRACFFTGRIPSQHGIHDYLYERSDEVNRTRWMEDETTLAQILSEAGYECALSGKWHCGQGDEKQPGFDYYFSLGRTQGVHFDTHTYWENNQPKELTGYKTNIITDHAIEYLRRRDTSRPFFLFVGFIATHSPWTGHPERIVSSYRDCTFDDVPLDEAYPFGRLAGESTIRTRFNRREALAQYYAAVTEIDEQFGRILDELEAQSLRENTLVVYTGDHGLCCGHHGIWGKGNGTRPYNMVEESIRIPMILNHPGQLFAGQVRSEFVDHTDLFQTVLDYVDVSLPEATVEERRYPGRSFRPALQGNRLIDWRDAYIGEYGNLRMIRTRRYKLVRRYPDGPCELFDLEADPRETVNLFHEPDQQVRVRELTERIDEHFKRYADPVKNGLRVRELPIHNPVEVWRGEHA